MADLFDGTGRRGAERTDSPWPRARRQLLVGIVPLIGIGLIVLGVMAMTLPGARAPLLAATQTATAEVTDNGAAGGTTIEVAFTDAEGLARKGAIVLAKPQVIPDAVELSVQYDPDVVATLDDPDDRVLVYTEGDAAHLAARNLLFGIFWVSLVLVICSAVTGLRLVSRPRLLRRPVTSATARRIRVRRGISDRSWLVLDHGGAVSWLPVYWDEAVSALRRDSPIVVHGNPGRDRLVLPIIDGRPIWPSGARRTSAPKGEAGQPPPQSPAQPKSMLRQARADAAGLFFAPLLGLLWAYNDESGGAGFFIATAISVGVLFWLPSIFGSDPTGPRDDD